MQSTSRSLSIGVILLLTLSCFSLFVSAQSESVQNHPTNDDPYMYIWGSENLDNCWTNFDNLSEVSYYSFYVDMYSDMHVNKDKDKSNMDNDY